MSTNVCGCNCGPLEYCNKCCPPAPSAGPVAGEDVAATRVINYANRTVGELTAELATLRAQLDAADQMAHAALDERDQYLRERDKLREKLAASEARVGALLAENARLQPIAHAAMGLCAGVDWSKGTHAVTHGYRQKLIDAVAALSQPSKGDA